MYEQDLISKTKYLPPTDSNIKAVYNTLEARDSVLITKDSCPNLTIRPSVNTRDQEGRIIFENAIKDQGVQLRFNHWDETRAPFGLHVEKTWDNTSPTGLAYLDVEGAIYTGIGIKSSTPTTRFIDGNKGAALVSSDATSGSYVAMLRYPSQNGIFTESGYGQGFFINYTDNATITAGTNTVTKSAKLLDEAGDSYFPGTVSAVSFNGALNGSQVTSGTVPYARLPVGTGGTQVAAGNHTHSYLPTAGGTLTGSLLVGTSDLVYTTSERGVYVRGYTDQASMEACMKLYKTGGFRCGLYDASSSFWAGYMDISSNGYLSLYSNVAGETQKMLHENSSFNIHLNGNKAWEGVYLHASSGTPDVGYNGTTFRSSSDNTITLGTSSLRWKTVYSGTGTINTSDRNKKNSIAPISEIYEKLFKCIKPVTYRFNDGDRTHIGAVSQDVEESMLELGLEPEDLAMFCKDVRKTYDIDESGSEIKGSERIVVDDNGDPVYDYSLRYTEMIMLNTNMIQKLMHKVENLEAEIEELKR